MPEKTLWEILTDQIVAGDISVDDARRTLVDYYKRKRSLKKIVADAVDEAIEKTLKRNDGNIRRTAAELGVSHETIYRRLKRRRERDASAIQQSETDSEDDKIFQDELGEEEDVGRITVTR